MVTTLGLVVNEPGAAPGYTLFHARSNDTAYLIDINGELAHQWRDSGRNPRLLPSGNLLTRSDNRIRELAPDGGIVWQYAYDGSLHHDIVPLPNGNVLLLGRATRTPAELIAAGADPQWATAEWFEYDTILEVKPTGPAAGAIVWQWSMWDYLTQDFDPARSNYGVLSDRPERIDVNYALPWLAEYRDPTDWTHGNALAYHPELDQIMLTIRNYSEIWVIDRSAGGAGRGLLYRWGNPRAYATGDASDQRLFWPHNAHWIAPGLPGAGNILVFNNGLEFPGYQRGWSSVVEITPPWDDDAGEYRRAAGSAYGPDAPVWSYAAPDDPADFYSRNRGGMQRLPNGNTLICYATQGTILEVTPAGRVVWQYVNPVARTEPLYQGDPISVPQNGNWANSLYRAHRYPPDYPGLAALDLTPKGTVERYRTP